MTVVVMLGLLEGMVLLWESVREEVMGQPPVVRAKLVEGVSGALPMLFDAFKVCLVCVCVCVCVCLIHNVCCI